MIINEMGNFSIESIKYEIDIICIRKGTLPVDLLDFFQ